MIAQFPQKGKVFKMNKMIEFISNHPEESAIVIILVTVLPILFALIKSTKNTLSELKKADKDEEDLEKKYFKEYDDKYNRGILTINDWSEKWSKSCSYQYFADNFKKSYRFAYMKSEKNRYLNFKYKNQFMKWIMFILITHISFAMLVVTNYYSWYICLIMGLVDDIPLDFSIVATIEVVLLVISAIGSIAIVKRQDIRKYQETWARHKRTLMLVDIEMLKYIDEISPYYNCYTPKALFMEKVTSLQEANIEKFAENLETKEKDLIGEIISLLKSSGK